MPETCSRRAPSRARGLGDAAGAVEVDGAEGAAAALDVERDGVGHGGGALDGRPDGDLVSDVGDDALQAVGGVGKQRPVGVAGGRTVAPRASSDRTIRRPRKPCRRRR